MGQILHKCATTTHISRKEIQNSKKTIEKLAKKYGINKNTVLKWKNRKEVEDLPFGNKKVRTVLTETEEKIIVETRLKTLLPLDDLYVTLKDCIKKLSRSNLHRCLKRHGISVLPKEEKIKEKRGKFKDYEIGYFHIDVAELSTEEGKSYLFVAIDRTSKFVYVELHKNKKMSTSASFVINLIKNTPYKIHKILTDNGGEFRYISKNLKKSQYEHPFKKVLKDEDIEHRLTKIKHPWTNGQVERFNRTIKDSTIKLYYYKSFDELKFHLIKFINAYNFGKKLKSLRFKTPYEFLINRLTKNPNLSKISSYDLVGPNKY